MSFEARRGEVPEPPLHPPKAFRAQAGLNGHMQAREKPHKVAEAAAQVLAGWSRCPFLEEGKGRKENEVLNSMG
jgi:hypothetical protein